MADIFEISGRIHSTSQEEVVTTSSEILDEEQNKKQSEVNADVDTALADRYTKEETYSKSQLDNLITTPDVQYVTVATYSALPATGEADTIYRVASWDGSTVDTSKYSEYAWNGSAYQLLAVRSGSIDGVYDISANNLTEGQPTQYADLAAALGTNGANVPVGVRAGGMQVRFINSSTDKYKQCRLMAASWSTTVTDWQDVDSTPTANSDNLVTSGGVYEIKEELENVENKSVFTDGGYFTRAEISIVDEKDNCVLQAKNGHIKTKNFDSSNAATKSEVSDAVANLVSSSELQEALSDFPPMDNAENDDESLSIVDEESNCIAQFKGGHLKTKNFDSSNIDIDKNYPEIIIPEKIYAVVDDNLQIFFRSIISSPNCYNYGISAVCNIGKSMPRYYEIQPKSADIGNHNLTINVYDNNGKIIVTKTTVIEVVNKLSSNLSPEKNILTIAASTYEGGNVVAEVSRRFSSATGDGTPANPTGLNLTGINFIGRQEKTVSGTTIHQEANGGWSWQKYATDSYKCVRFNVNTTGIVLGAIYKISGVAISSKYYFTVIGINEEDILCEPYGGYVYTEQTVPASGTLEKYNSSVQGADNVAYSSRVLESGNPFWNPDKTGGAGIDFTNYSTLYCSGASIDFIYTHLGLNGFYNKASVDATITNYIKPFIRQYHADYPNGKFILGTLQLGTPNGGYGYKGYANAEQNWFNLSNVYWYALKKFEELTKESEFSSYVFISDCTPEFDCEYGYPTSPNTVTTGTVYANNRTGDIEVVQTNQIHPAVDGDKMISDSIYRSMSKLLN